MNKKFVAGSPRTNTFSQFSARQPSRTEMRKKYLVMAVFTALSLVVAQTIGQWPLPEDTTTSLSQGQKTATSPFDGFTQEDYFEYELRQLSPERRQQMEHFSRLVPVPYGPLWGGDERPAMLQLWRSIYRSIRSDLDYRVSVPETTTTTEKQGNSSEKDVSTATQRENSSLTPVSSRGYSYSDTASQSQTPTESPKVPFGSIPAVVYETQAGYVSASLARFIPQLSVLAVSFSPHTNDNHFALTREQQYRLRQIESHTVVGNESRPVINERALPFGYSVHSDASGNSSRLTVCPTNSSFVTNDLFARMGNNGLSSAYTFFLYPYSLFSGDASAGNATLFCNSIVSLSNTSTLATFIALPNLAEVSYSELLSESLHHRMEYSFFTAVYRQLHSEYRKVPLPALLQQCARITGVEADITALEATGWAGLPRDLLRIENIRSVGTPTAVRNRGHFGCGERTVLLGCDMSLTNFSAPLMLC